MLTTKQLNRGNRKATKKNLLIHKMNMIITKRDIKTRMTSLWSICRCSSNRDVINRNYHYRNTINMYSFQYDSNILSTRYS
uniref:Uncharacterized protein n=1 Tax=Hyaloperonospora arabidopsidis (strain Emoy2) TaxID=559515 RepID=M4C1W7_HYAAE